MKNETLLEQSKKAFKETKNKGLKYLIKTIMMTLSERLEDYETNKELYAQLIREFKNIPSPYRNLVGKSLKANYAKTYKIHSKDFRMWSDIHNTDVLDTTVLLNAQTRRLLTDRKIGEAVTLFHQIYNLALKYPHPTFVLSGANNVVWYSYKANQPVESKMIKNVLYNCGIFFDEESALINSLDTLLTVLKHYNHLLYFETAEIMLFYYNRLIKKESGYKEKFVGTIKKAKSLSPCVLKPCKRKDEIRNTQKLQLFLKKHIVKVNLFAKENGISKTILYDILNGKTKCIKSESLKKIFRALRFNELSFDYPRTVNHVIQMIKEDDIFKKNRESIFSFSIFDLKSLLLKGFMTLVSLEGINLSKLFSLAEKDRRKLYNLIKSEPNLIVFFNRCLQFEVEPENVNPFFRARLDLVHILFSEIKKTIHLQSLITLYESIESIDGYEKLNIYFRQYVRYSSTHWRFSVEDVMSERYADPNYKRLSLFCKRSNISEFFGYLCTWEFEGEERNKLIEILTKKIV